VDTPGSRPAPRTWRVRATSVRTRGCSRAGFSWAARWFGCTRPIRRCRRC